MFKYYNILIFHAFFQHICIVPLRAPLHVHMAQYMLNICTKKPYQQVYTIMRIIIFIICFTGIILFSAGIYENTNALRSNVLSILIVCGGTFLATAISFPRDKLRIIGATLKKAYSSDSFPYARYTRRIVQTAREYKRSGFKSLLHASKSYPNPYLQIGLRMVADGSAWEDIKTSLDKEFLFEQDEIDTAERVLRSMSKYAPSFGLAGTIIGLMRIFPQLSNPHNIGHAISLALLTTLYGVLFSNLVFLPLANKLRDKAEDDTALYRYILEALSCVYDKEYSIVIEQRLKSAVPSHALRSYKSSTDTSMHISAGLSEHA